MSDWRDYVKRFYTLSPQEQQVEWDKLTPEQRAQFETARTTAPAQSSRASSKSQLPRAAIFGCLALLLLVILAGAGLLTLWGGNREAERAAREYWDTQLTECSGSWYEAPTQRTYLRQYKGLTTYVESTGVTEADKANGYEWKGFTGLRSEMFREWRAGGWEEWAQGTPGVLPGARTLGGPRMLLSKRGGKWQYLDRDLDAYRTTKKPVCGQIPK